MTSTMFDGMPALTSGCLQLPPLTRHSNLSRAARLPSLASMRFASVNPPLPALEPGSACSEGALPTLEQSVHSAHDASAMWVGRQAFRGT